MANSDVSPNIFLDEFFFINARGIAFRSRRCSLVYALLSKKIYKRMDIVEKID